MSNDLQRLEDDKKALLAQIEDTRLQYFALEDALKDERFITNKLRCDMRRLAKAYDEVSAEKQLLATELAKLAPDAEHVRCVEVQEEKAA